MFRHFDKIECKHCDKKSYFSFVILLHLYFSHKLKPTKRDIKFAIKFGVFGTIIYNIFMIIKLIIKIICYPFYLIYTEW